MVLESVVAEPLELVEPHMRLEEPLEEVLLLEVVCACAAVDRINNPAVAKSAPTVRIDFIVLALNAAPLVNE